MPTLLLRNIFRHAVLSAALATAVASVASPAHAQSGQDEVAELRAQIEALSARLSELEAAREESEGNNNASKTRDSSITDSSHTDVPQVTMSGSGLEVASAGGDYNINIGGRLHLDFVQHEHVTGLPLQPVSGSAIRRSRLEIEGTLARNWKFAAELDFAENRTRMKDIKVGYAGDNYTLYAGNQKQPYSLALEMSSNDLPWVERSYAVVAELVDRAIGVRYDVWGDNWFAAAGVFGDKLGNAVQGEEGWAAMGRFIYSPVQTENAVLHLGVRAAHREFGDNLDLNFQDKSSDFSGLNIIDTGTLDMVESADLFGPEVAVAMGSLLVMGEYSSARINRIGMDDLDFSWWYVGASLALTGERRADAYSIKNGEFKGLRPAQSFSPSNGTWGAFELTARYSTLDLNDGVVFGGEVDKVSAGINWILNPNIRIMADWTQVLDTDDYDPVRALIGGMGIFTLRTQYNY